jgi:4-diphosphocytidyl-2-C-methyl-D-erythritol kinase
LEPLECSRNWWAALICPAVRLSAAEVYGALRLTGAPPITDNSFRLDGNGFFAAIGGLHNDLEQVVIGRVPVLQRWRSHLVHAGARQVLVSGSGPTIVGFFDFVPDPQTLRIGMTSGVRIIVARPVATRHALTIG